MSESELDKILDWKLGYSPEENCPICGHDHIDSDAVEAKAKFKQALNLYIEERERLARIDELNKVDAIDDPELTPDEYEALANIEEYIKHRKKELKG